MHNCIIYIKAQKHIIIHKKNHYVYQISIIKILNKIFFITKIKYFFNFINGIEKI